MIMSDVLNVPGLGALVDDLLAEPQTVRWVSISPAGQLQEHDTGNRHAFCEKLDCRLQWQLVCDVYAAIDPHGQCGDHLLSVGEIVNDDERGGRFLVPCRHGDGGQENPLASAMLHRLPGKHPPVVHGTVAWIGYAADDGLHTSATGEQVAALRALPQAVYESPPANAQQNGCA
jgi:hypothetical protein